VLESSEIRGPDPEAVQRAALAGLAQPGLGALPWTEGAAAMAGAGGADARNTPSPRRAWPDLSDEALLATLDEWAPPWMEGLVRREHFARMDLAMRCMRA
jgi:ATP-dependent helicase HrpB